MAVAAPAKPPLLTVEAAQEMMAAARKLASQAEQATGKAAAAATALKKAEEAVTRVSTVLPPAIQGKRVGQGSSQLISLTLTRSGGPP